MDPDSSGNRTFVLLIIWSIIVLIYVCLREKIDSPYFALFIVLLLSFLNIVNMYFSNKERKGKKIMIVRKAVKTNCLLDAGVINYTGREGRINDDIKSGE